MHPRLQEISEHFDRQRTVLRSAVASVPVELHDALPAEGAWSVRMVLEHLVIVETRIGAALRRTLNEARANGVADETDDSPILATLGADQLLDRTKKIKAPEASHPTLSRPLDEIWSALDETRESMRGLMSDASGLKLTEVTMPHPVFGPLHLYTWFAFVGSHEARHAAQIRETGETLITA